MSSYNYLLILFYLWLEIWKNYTSYSYATTLLYKAKVQSRILLTYSYTPSCKLCKRTWYSEVNVKTGLNIVGNIYIGFLPHPTSEKRRIFIVHTLCDTILFFLLWRLASKGNQQTYVFGTCEYLICMSLYSSEYLLIMINWQ